MFNEIKLREAINAKGYTNIQLCREIGMVEKTYYDKLKRNGAFSRDEIAKIMECLEIDEAKGIFF